MANARQLPAYWEPLVFEHPKPGNRTVMGKTMTIIRLHRVQITIPRAMEKQGREFYCDLLGLPEIEKPAALRGRGGFWLQVGDRQVHVGTEENVQRDRKSV